jgi:hypothetical protein
MLKELKNNEPRVNFGKFVFALVMLFVLIFTGCDDKDKESPGISLKPFNDAILSLRQNDGFLSKEDIDSLKNLVLAAKGGRLAKWKDSENNVNIDSLANYICKILLEKGNITQDRRSIIDPVSENFNINFFIKNTANMNGYIKPKSQFQDALFGLLADLKSGFRSSNINLNYVNTVVTYSVPYDNSDVIGNYIYKIDRNKFIEFGKKNGGNVASTDFDLIFGHVLETVDKNNIAVLAADFIFSPGNVADVNDYLEKQRNSIRVKFSHKIEELNLAVFALKMESDFDGNYWNKKGVNVGRLIAKRPYYIWFIGSQQHLSKIAGNERLFVTLKSNGFTGDRMVFESSGAEKQSEFKIGASEKYSFDNKTSTIKAKRLKKGDKYNFILDVNFNDAFRDSAFFADADNYDVKDYELSINAKQPRNFKHRLSLTSEKLTQGALKISVMGKIPEWINNVNSTDDANIRRDVSEQTKTYGFKHIVDGVYSAFYPTISMNELHVLQTINLNIQLED